MKRIVLLALFVSLFSLIAIAQSPLNVAIDQATHDKWNTVVTQFQSETGIKVSLALYPQTSLHQQIVLQGITRSDQIQLVMVHKNWGTSLLRYFADLRAYEGRFSKEGLPLAYAGGKPVGVWIPFAPDWFLAVLSWPTNPEVAVTFLEVVGSGSAALFTEAPTATPEAMIASFATTKIDLSKHNPKIDGSLEALIGAATASVGTMAANFMSKLPQTARTALDSLASLYGIPFASSTSTVTVVLKPQGGRATSANVAALSTLGISRTAIEASTSLIKVTIPLSQLATLAEQVAGIVFIRPPYTPYELSVPGQGTGVIGADAFHAAGITGSGAKVAIIDLGFSGLSQAQARGDLPYSVHQHDLTGTGLTSGITHGTAVAEIVHEIAPNAELYLIKIADEVDLDLAVTYCLNNGIDIINHSLGWYNTNFYDGTGTIAEIAKRAVSGGILWVNAAGNEGESHWEATFSDSNSDNWNDQSLTFHATSGSQTILYMTWNDWPQAGSDYDLYLYDPFSNLVASSTKHQTGTEEPTESIFTTVSLTGTYTVRVKGSGSKKIEIYNLYQNISPAIASSSILAPANVAEVVTVGAIDYAHYTTGPQESYSSQGPTNDGRVKPDVCAPDNVSTGTSSYTSFPGTSAAAPHVAGAAALLLSQEPSLTESALRSHLLSETVAMGSPYIYGQGRLVLTSPSPANQPPTASFSYSPPSPLVGAWVTFDGSSSNDPDGTVVSYAWSFGDGSSGSGVTAYHPYSTPGTYTVGLTVTDDDGASDTTTQQVTVSTQANQPPTASFTYSPPSPLVGTWVTFDGSSSNDPDGTIVSYAWNFGDGSSGSGIAQHHQYPSPGTYTVRLTVTDDDGASNTTTQQVTVSAQANQPPTASFSYSPPSPLVGAWVTFDGSSSSDPDGTIVSYTWSFGDGSSGSGITAYHPYSTPGTYTVNLTVTDDDGASNTTTRQVTVSAQANQPPTASFTYSPPSPLVGAWVTFDGSSSNDPDGTIVSYTWSFGDGSSGSGIAPHHQYSTPGTYTARLTVTDDDGASNTTTQQVTVITQPSPSLSVQLSLPKGTYEVGEPIVIGYTTNREAYVYICDVDTTGKVTLLFPSYLEPNNRVLPGTHSLPGTGYTLRVSEPTGNEILYAFAATSPIPGFPTSFGSSFPVLSYNPSSFRNSVRQTMQTQFPPEEWAEDTLSFTVVSAASTTGTLWITSSPQGASIAIDGVPSGTTPTQIAVAAGTHTVSLSLAGYQTAIRQVTVAAGQTAHLNVPLVPATSNQPPVATFFASPSSGALVGQTVLFNASGSYDPDGSIISYTWNFGDGTSGSGLTPHHQYSSPGTYTVLLTVTDNQGATGTTTQPVSIGSAPSLEPRAYWRFNEGSGTTASDSSGNGNHGTIRGATWTTSADGSRALAFDGANDYVEVSNAGSLNPTSALTLEAWIKLNSSGKNQIVVEKPYTSHVAPYYQYILRVNYSSEVSFNVSLNGQCRTLSSSGANLAVGTWYHVAGVYDGQYLRVYVNGVLKGSASVGSGVISSYNTGLYIGKHGNVASEKFQGILDNVKIHGRALNPSEFTLPPSGGPEPTPLGWTNPTGDSGSKWSNRENARDGNTSTKALTGGYDKDDIGKWTQYLIGTHDAFYVNRLRVLVQSRYFTRVDIDVFNLDTNSWQGVYEGNRTGTKEWVETGEFPTVRTDKMRVRLQLKSHRGFGSLDAPIYEMEFHAVTNP